MDSKKKLFNIKQFVCLHNARLGRTHYINLNSANSTTIIISNAKMKSDQEQMKALEGNINIDELLLLISL